MGSLFILKIIGFQNSWKFDNRFLLLGGGGNYQIITKFDQDLPLNMRPERLHKYCECGSRIFLSFISVP